MPKLLPFNFERLTNNKILISNDIGHFDIFESDEELKNLVAGELEGDKYIDARNKLFIAQDEAEFNIFSKLITSGLSFKYKANLCRPSLFIVIPTLRCDHNCNYCQVSRVDENKVGFDLDINLIPKIIESIHKYGRAPFKIEFQGGEPLLRFDIIKEFILQFENLSPNTTYVIATTLSKLDEEIIDFSRSYNLQFSVSLDGMKTVHDRNRKNLLGSSYDFAIRGMNRIRHELGEDRLGTVTTATKELLENPKDLIDIHREIDIKEIFVRPLSPYGFAHKKYNLSYNSDKYIKFYRELIMLLCDSFESERMTEANAKIHLRKIFDNKFSGYVDLKSPSGHLLGAMVFDYSGKVFGSDEARMIYKRDNIDELVIADLHDEDINIENNLPLINTLSNTFITEMPGCRECAFSPYCGSDPMHHISTQVDVVGNKAISHFCKIQKGIFNTLFQFLDDNKYEQILKEWTYA